MTTCATFSPLKGSIARPYAREESLKGRIAKSSFRIPGLTREIHAKIATEKQELEQAFKLLAANYIACGYEAPSEKPYRFTPYHALPGTVTLIAKHDGRVVATLSLVPDTAALGLPMESIYGDEVAGLRRDGYKMAEAISLADSDLSVREFVQVFKSLIKLAMQYHVSRGGNCWIITVNPRHRNFYQKVLGFEPMGSRRSYPTVQNHPAEAFMLHIDRLKNYSPEMYQEIFGDELPASVLSTGRWSPQLIRYFGLRSTQVDGRSLEDLFFSIERSGKTPRWSQTDCKAERTPSFRPQPNTV